MKTKIITTSFECQSCGTILNKTREIIVDEYLKEIKIDNPICSCRNKRKFRLLDIKIEEREYEKNSN